MNATSADEAEPLPAALGWFGVVAVALCGAAAALLEVLLVPLYAGSVVAPVAVVLALASNLVLPRMARRIVSTTLAAVLPFLAWLAVIVFFGVLTRPEGDVILPGGSGALTYVGYGVMLGGALAGTISVVTSVPPPARAPRPPDPGVTRR